MDSDTYTVTVEDQTFQVRVPKGSSDDYIEKAASDYYENNFRKGSSGISYRTTATAPSLYGMEIPAPRNEENSRALLGPTVHQPNPGFIESAGQGLSGLGHMIMHPIDTASRMIHSMDTPPELKALLNDPNADEGVVMQALYSNMLENPIIPYSTINKFATGNVSGGLGDLVPYALTLGAAKLPFRTIGGALKGAAGELPEAVKAGGISALLGKQIHPSLRIPAALIGAAKPIIEGAIKGGERANFPALRGFQPAEVRPVAPTAFPEFSPQNLVNLPKFNANIPSPTMPQSPAVLPIQPATFSEFSPQNLVNLPEPSAGIPATQFPRIRPTDTTGSTVRGSSTPTRFERPNTVINPSGQRYTVPNFKPKSSVIKPEPRIEEQQVPAVTQSVKETLPSGKALNLSEDSATDTVDDSATAGPKTEKQKIADVVAKHSKPKTEPKVAGTTPEKLKVKNPIQDKPQTYVHKSGEVRDTRFKELDEEIGDSAAEESSPKFSKDIMGNIAKSLSTKNNKFTLQEVGRFIHKKYGEGSYEPGQFNKDYGASRAAKTGRKIFDPDELEEREGKIDEAVKQYIKSHAKEF